jgi:hypothetical protein
MFPVNTFIDVTSIQAFGNIPESRFTFNDNEEFTATSSTISEMVPVIRLNDKPNNEIHAQITHSDYCPSTHCETNPSFVMQVQRRDSVGTNLLNHFLTMKHTVNPASQRYKSEEIHRLHYFANMML